MWGYWDISATRNRHYGLIRPRTQNWWTKNWCNPQFQKWETTQKSIFIIINDMHPNGPNFQKWQKSIALSCISQEDFQFGATKSNYFQNEHLPEITRDSLISLHIPIQSHWDTWKKCLSCKISNLYWKYRY